MISLQDFSCCCLVVSGPPVLFTLLTLVALMEGPRPPKESPRHTSVPRQPPDPRPRLAHRGVQIQTQPNPQSSQAITQEPSSPASPPSEFAGSGPAAFTCSPTHAMRGGLVAMGLALALLWGLILILLASVLHGLVSIREIRFVFFLALIVWWFLGVGALIARLRVPWLTRWHIDLMGVTIETPLRRHVLSWVEIATRWEVRVFPTATMLTHPDGTVLTLDSLFSYADLFQSRIRFELARHWGA